MTFPEDILTESESESRAETPADLGSWWRLAGTPAPSAMAQRAQAI